MNVPVAQRIERQPPELDVQVRFLSGAPLKIKEERKVRLWN